MSPTPRSEPRSGSGLGRAAAVVAACGLLFGVGGTAVPLPTASELLASDDNWQRPGVVAPASATISFRPPGSIMANGGFSTGTGPGLGGLPGISASPGSPGFGGPAVPGFPGGGAVPGSSLFAQPGPASVEGSLSAVVPFAYQGLGHSYVWGGTSFTHGWDCSGFAQWAFAKAGFYLPRVSQWEVLAPTNTPRPGDLVTQRPDGPNHWAHVGIYIGDGMMISALNPAQGTIIHSVGPPGTSWYFTLPGTENVPYNPGELTAGITVPPRTSPSTRFAAPSSALDTRRHNDDGGSRSLTDIRRTSSSGDTNDRSHEKAKGDRNDGNDKKSRPAHQDPRPKDHDSNRDKGSDQKDSKRDKQHQQGPDKDATPHKNPSDPPKDSKPGKTPPPKDQAPAPETKPKPEPVPEAGTQDPQPKPPVPEPTPTTPPAPTAPNPTPPKPETTVPPVQETTPPPPTTPPVQETTPPPPTTPPVPKTPPPAPPTTPPAAPAANITGNLNAAAGALAKGTAAVQALGTVVAAPQVGDIILYTNTATGKAHVAVVTGAGMVTATDGTQSALGAGGTYQVIRPA